jgi:hypothetical protein
MRQQVAAAQNESQNTLREQVRREVQVAKESWHNEI